MENSQRKAEGEAHLQTASYFTAAAAAIGAQSSFSRSSGVHLMLSTPLLYGRDPLRCAGEC